MKKVRASSSSPVLAGLLLAVLAVASSSAQAGTQWKWRDAQGATQYSDRPPPAGTPDKDILSRPALPKRAAKAPTDAASAASGQAVQATAAASKPADPELEAKRKKAEDEKTAKQKAEDDKIAKQKAENCDRARGYKRTLDDGIRIVRNNAKGEREFLDDKARAEEMQRTQEAISANCGK